MSENSKLETFIHALDDQDELLAQTDGLNMAHFRTIQEIFREINDVYPGTAPDLEFNGKPQAMRSQIRAVRSKLIGMAKSVPTPADKELTAADPRRVMVVHGRNVEARNAVFDFLRSINLDPIEWEEAIAMTSEGSPFIGAALEHAFGNSQAAVVLLTGDDLARLGKRYLTSYDPPSDKYLTAQARPNVLFEAGMAFATYPKRTIMVSLGSVRPFSDIAGRHFVHFSDTVASRQKLADRLRTAGCLLKTEGKSDWHSAGDFTLALHDPDIPKDSSRFHLTRLNRWVKFDMAAHFSRKVWVQMRNDGDEYLKISQSGWKQTPGGIKAKHVSPTLQIKLGDTWCPDKRGVEGLHLHPGATLQTWIEPTVQHTEEDIQHRIEAEEALRHMILRVNGISVEFSA